MVTYNSVITRDEAAPLIPEEATREIWKAATRESAALKLFKRVSMSRGQTRMPVQSVLASAYWVDGDTGLKQTTEVNWSNKYLYAEELACIVPISEAVLADADYDIWGETVPSIAEALGQTIDQAIFFGTNKPSAWPDDVVAGATSASNTVDGGSGNDFARDISDAMAKVEADGFDPTGHAAGVGVKANLRNLRDENGQPIFQPDLTKEAASTVYGLDTYFVRNGGWSTSEAQLITGDFTQGVIGVRQDLQMKVLDQAVITDGDGLVVYNLAQQDMVALRVTMRVAWQVPNPETRENTTDASRYPFAIITGGGS